MAAKFFEGEAESASGNGEATQAPPPGVPPAGDDGYRSEVKTPARLALDSAFRAQTDLRLGIVENLRRARAENDSRDARVARAFENFDPSVPARNEPEPRNHVAANEAPFGAIDQAIRDRIETLRDTTPRPGITLRAHSTLIDWENGDEPTSGTIELGKLVDLVDNRDVATLTLPAEPALTAAEAERKAQALLDGLPDADEDRHDGHRAADAHGAVDPEKVSDFVEKAVVEQMGPATAPESRLEYGLIPNGADSNSAQAHLLDTFELRPGPTDVTSYHDFSTLQIAFENVWTKIFDGELEALGREIYREYVGLVDFLGYDPDTADRPISSLDDLTWLIGEIRRLSQLAQNALPPGGGGTVGTNNIPKPDHDLGTDVGNAIDQNFPGGRVGAAVATLGISELVLLFLREAGNFGKKPALAWDDLVHGRKLAGGDRIAATIDRNAVALGQVELVLKTSARSHKKAVVFQVLDKGSQKFINILDDQGHYKGVYNYDTATLQVLNDANNQPEFYEDMARLDTSALPTGLLQFVTEETSTIGQGRYVLGDLDIIIPDGGRLTLYWTDS